MKTNFLIILAAVAAGVFANPEANPEASLESNLQGDDLAKRAACHKPSVCSMFWSGNCERWCTGLGFSHMSKSGCGFAQKKCCCKA